MYNQILQVDVQGLREPDHYRFRTQHVQRVFQLNVSNNFSKPTSVLSGHRSHSVAHEDPCCPSFKLRLDCQRSVTFIICG